MSEEKKTETTTTETNTPGEDAKPGEKKTETTTTETTSES
jgi:hypothetical protein